LPCPLRVGVRFWASLTLRKLANASGRIVFNIALFMDWQFISGCLPPRLSTTQFPSTTDSQCSVRWGLPPHGWCALSGARRDALPRDARQDVRWLTSGVAPLIVYAFRRVRRSQSGCQGTLDCGSGAGAWSRDPDAVLDLVEQKYSTQEERILTAEITVRDFPPIENFVVRWNFPLLERDTGGCASGS